MTRLFGSILLLPLLLLLLLEKNNNNGKVVAFTTTSFGKKTTRIEKKKIQQQQRLYSTTTSSSNNDLSSNDDSTISHRRPLGSQELLMLPRQYGPGKDTFPQMNHVSTVVLSATPSLKHLQMALEQVMKTHALLRAKVIGDGEPDERIDLFQMVRKGDPNPCTFVVNDDENNKFTADNVLQIINLEEEKEDLTLSWQKSFQYNLDHGDWCQTDKGPLWKIEWHIQKENSDQPCAFVFSFNHAISDQKSANMITDQILTILAQLEQNQQNDQDDSSFINNAIQQDLPLSLEDSVLGLDRRFANIQTKDMSLQTIQYVASKAAEGFKSPVILPDIKDNNDKDEGFWNAITTITGRAAGGKTSQERKSVLNFQTLSRDETKNLLQVCRSNGVSITNALSAAMTLTATDYIDNNNNKNSNKNDEEDEVKQRNYKVLQSLDMRRFGQKLDCGETVACMAGSMDLMHGPLPDGSGAALLMNNNLDLFWNLAKEGRQQTNEFVRANGPQEATRVFDFAMTISDMNNLVHLTAQSKSSQGRAYSAGISNVGVYERQEATRKMGQDKRDFIKTKHGRFEITDLYFATSHSRTGCLYQVSCMTVGGELMCTFHPASPIVSEETNTQFANSFMKLLKRVAATGQQDNEKEETTKSSNDIKPANAVGGGIVAFSQQQDGNNNNSPILKEEEEEEEKEKESFIDRLLPFPSGTLPLLAAVVGIHAIGIHGDAYRDFYNSLMEMKANVANPEDFGPALNFWIFFAVGHPILQPILWISDVLHGSPGPKVLGDELVPLSFLIGNLVAIAAVAFSKEIRNAVNVAALTAFLAYVGAGLDGQAGLGDYNLGLDDPYKGQIVKGCPAYDEVRQPSMDDFDINKYQGLWYEQKFHDWTQFKEVYDTTLDIKLTEGGKGWVDDFAVKGPAPEAAKLSWDKSPVANGAHYFLFGRVDEKDPPGILRESGFGVEFPNYIVDVQKDAETGEYTEAIQFQCLERGGVRVFEGINFMSRKPEMSADELTAMHQRAKKAGMYPYGASPEQMHTVARRPIDAPKVDNNWQAMWRAIGFDKLLELVTESIEDGGR